ncbi:hypothetical protein [Limimaricola soesokkakensis]|uniref:hypothetical protein n=1 Tax=Limimaricola soesokkakensis TaxID=1343159 RepID=UPI0035172C44
MTKTVPIIGRAVIRFCAQVAGSTTRISNKLTPDFHDLRRTAVFGLAVRNMPRQISF